VYGQDSLFYRALQLGQYALLGDWSLIRKVVSGIRAVTAADLLRVAHTYLREDNRTVGIMLPDNPEKIDHHQKQASPPMKTTGKKSKKKAPSQQAQ
jgi:predicted Zn-dependent peptidase